MDNVEVNTEDLEAQDNEIIFSSDKGWMIKVSEEGIIFNTQDFPNLSADEFAQEFIEILQSEFMVRMPLVEFVRKVKGEQK